MVVVAFLIRSTDTLGVLVLKALGLSEGMQALSATALGMGYVVGALVVGQWGGRFTALSIFGTGIAMVGAMLAGIGFAAALGLSGVGVIVAAGFAARLVLGMGYGSLVVAYGYILQRNTPGTMMGRVSATSGSLIAGIPLISPLIGTFLARWIGLGVAYAFLALLVVGVAAFVIVLSFRIRANTTG
jgi:MFS family permease